MAGLVAREGNHGGHRAWGRIWGRFQAKLVGLCYFMLVSPMFLTLAVIVLDGFMLFLIYGNVLKNAMMVEKHEATTSSGLREDSWGV